MLSNVNGRKLAYALTADGINELTERDKKFAMRTFRIANEYSKALINAFENAEKNAKTKVILYGKSHIEFLLKYAAGEAGLDFEKKPCSEK